MIGRTVRQLYDATDWAPGDLAECIVGGDWVSIAGGQPKSGPKLGQVSRVVSVEPDVGSLRGVFWLTLAGFGNEQYISTHFRKVIPRADQAERADAIPHGDFRRLLPDNAPARKPEPVA